VRGQTLERNLGIALAVLMGCAILLSQMLGDDVASQSKSAQSKTSSGRRGAVLLLDALGHGADDWRQAPGAIPRTTAMVWMPRAPSIESDTDGGALLGDLHDPLVYYDFAEQGGVLVLAATAEAESFLVEQLELNEFDGAVERDDVYPGRGLRTVRLPATGEELTLEWFDDEPFRGAQEPLEYLYPDASGRPLAISLEVGNGRVVVMGDDGFLDNDRIGQQDHGLFLARFVEEFAPGGPILFDEYSLGRWAPMSASELAFTSPYKSVSWHLLVILLVFVWRQAWVREFPRDPRAIERLSALARARSSASLFQRAGRWSLLGAQLRGGVLRRLAVFTRVSLPDMPHSESEEELGARSELVRYSRVTDELLEGLARRSDLMDRLPEWRRWLQGVQTSGVVGLEDHARRLAAIEREVEAARIHGSKRRSVG